MEISLGVVESGFVATFRRANSQLKSSSNEAASPDMKDRSSSIEQLRHSTLTKLVASMADAVVTASPSARLTGINAAAEQLFGWKQEELIGTLFNSCVHQCSVFLLPLTLSCREIGDRVDVGQRSQITTSSLHQNVS